MAGVGGVGGTATCALVCINNPNKAVMLNMIVFIFLFLKLDLVENLF